MSQVTYKARLWLSKNQELFFQYKLKSAELFQICANNVRNNN